MIRFGMGWCAGCVLVLALAIGSATAQAATRPFDIFTKVEAGEISVTDGIAMIKDLDDAAADATVLAVHGTLLTMRAAEQWMPYNRLKSVNEGLELLDQATAKVTDTSPDFLRVYIFAAVANASVPGFLDRADFAKQYFKAVKAHQYFEAMEADVRARVFAWMARLEGTDSDAGQTFLVQARTLDADVTDAVLKQE